MSVISRLLLFLPIFILSACTQPPAADCTGLEIIDAWMHEPPPGPPVAAGYMTLKNNAEKDILIQAFSSPDFGSIELHENLQEDGRMKMRRLESLTVPATEGLALQPGGWHLMLFDPVQRPTAGQTHRITLHCGDGSITTVAKVRKITDMHHQHHGHH